ncbi:glycoside hydrolase domain-containing protein [Pseudahrensia aquimaris]|uniref:Glycoside hydrolase domain-containing protein n=1 Tax=Pseudahrensia aquimaris TaxID=744461 RepID=A0ABW3FF09_9HYPH
MPIKFSVFLVIIFISTIRSASADIAIVDVAVRTTPYLTELKSDGVKIVGRYYARCYQWSGKRLINMGPNNSLKGSKEKKLMELKSLLNANFGILSIYQYKSNWIGKFFGRTRAKIRNKKGQHVKKDGRYQYKYSTIKGDGCKTTRQPHGPKKEALLDAGAAIAQAEFAGQPKGSAIYFGLDFNFGGRIDSVEKKNILGGQSIKGNIRSEAYKRVLVYVQTVKAELAKHGYKLGIYGSGDAFKLLSQGFEQPIFDFSWIMASRSFSGTRDFHNTMKWNLFQNWTDKKRYGPKSGYKNGLGLDTNIQNPNLDADIGFWNAAGTTKIQSEISEAIFSSHRFVCDGRAWIRTKPTFKKSDIAVTRDGKPRRLYHANSVNLTGKSVNIGSSTLVEFDSDDDGQVDGWTNLNNLTDSFANKPQYYSVSKGENKTCPK